MGSLWLLYARAAWTARTGAAGVGIWIQCCVRIHEAAHETTEAPTREQRKHTEQHGLAHAAADESALLSCVKLLLICHAGAAKFCSCCSCAAPRLRCAASSLLGLCLCSQTLCWPRCDAGGAAAGCAAAGCRLRRPAARSRSGRQKPGRLCEGAPRVDCRRGGAF